MKIDPMPALTIWQPWASLLAILAKRFETRSWATSYRGPIAIHAALRSPTGVNYPEYRVALEACKALGFDWPNKRSADLLDGLPRGCIIATAELVGCYEILPSRASTGEVGIHLPNGKHFVTKPGEDEYFFGDWTPGRFAWELANAQLLPEPIPAKGHQRLWTWEGVA